jgi:hypothetical protein
MNQTTRTDLTHKCGPSRSNNVSGPGQTLILRDKYTAGKTKPFSAKWKTIPNPLAVVTIMMQVAVVVVVMLIEMRMSITIVV